MYKLTVIYKNGKQHEVLRRDFLGFYSDDECYSIRYMTDTYTYDKDLVKYIELKRIW